MKSEGQSFTQILPVGQKSIHCRTVTTEMVRAYADLVGDYDPIHFDEEFCKHTVYGRPVAHGALLIGFMSAASTAATIDSRIPMVSLGYDRIRLIGPVFPGDEARTTFTILAHDEARKRIIAEVQVHVDERLVAVATNILKVID